jgi:hypothetical protein
LKNCVYLLQMQHDRKTEIDPTNDLYTSPFAGSRNPWFMLKWLSKDATGEDISKDLPRGFKLQAVFWAVTSRFRSRDIHYLRQHHATGKLDESEWSWTNVKDLLKGIGWKIQSDVRAALKAYPREDKSEGVVKGRQRGDLGVTEFLSVSIPSRNHQRSKSAGSPMRNTNSRVSKRQLRPRSVSNSSLLRLSSAESNSCPPSVFTSVAGSNHAGISPGWDQSMSASGTLPYASASGSRPAAFTSENLPNDFELPIITLDSLDSENFNSDKFLADMERSGDGFT